MLGKLLKYEIKATGRLFVPVYLVLLLFAAVNRFLNPFQAFQASNSFDFQIALRILGTIIYFALLVGLMVMTLIIVLQRFYKNLLGNEGYLMFTLPVKSWMHITSKLLVSLMWTLLSFLTFMVSLIIMAINQDILREIPRLIRLFLDSFGVKGLVIMPLYAILAWTLNILMFYSAMALGHLFSRHRIIASFGMYCLLYIAYQIIMVVFVLLFGVDLLQSGPSPATLNSFISSLSIIAVLLIAGLFGLANSILKRKLNLE